ncbi:MAG TPA: gamma-glutamyl-gamma-aminobutyrate hydrolase family protein [Bacilli bacterium]|nr:gamma-glutamyl-gamma-aminobutyrate hydrolase family protein [Bacilli bacterium]
MNKPIIGIIARSSEIVSGYNVMMVHESLRRAIIRAGGIPILILPSQDVEYEKQIPREMKRLTDDEKEDIIKQINLCDGIVMPGGLKWYEYDMFICNFILDNDIPTLGLCMGMQLLAYVDNMRKSTDIVTIEKNVTNIDHCQKGIKYVHDVRIVDNTNLKKIVKLDTLNVNSRHNYHVSGINEAIVSAYSQDNLIEAIEFPKKRFIIGVQWHPETILDEKKYNQDIFDSLIEASLK